MEGEIDETGILDYALFHTSATQNSYEGLACSEGKIETVASGHLDQLALYLSEAKGCQFNQSDASFKLQLVGNQKSFSWFTKDTLARFLHIVNMAEALKVAVAIEGEMAQLEETKKFHISLYAKDQDQSAGVTADISCFKDIGTNQQIKVETASSDAAKNELLGALDLRLMSLEEELASSFNRAAGATCPIQQISDLSTFTGYFGAIDLRNFLLKLLARRPKNQPIDSFTDSLVVNHVSSEDMRNNSDNLSRESSHRTPDTLVKPVKNVVSPAKIAQVERQSSSESEESSDSSDEDQSRTERSRSLVRSATSRRSASPMRHIQIGRSGSRRSTALTIQSLNYFPPRERSSFIRDADGSNSEDDEEPNQPLKKPENAVRRMNVQDAISLFESKQKDQNSDVQKRRVVGEISASTTAKSVLRRWRAGMGASLTHISHENVSVATPQDTTEETKSAQVQVGSSNTDDSQVAQSSEVENSTLPPIESHAEPGVTKVEEVNDRLTASAEGSRQKEAELNQMLMKMMDSSKPGKHEGTRSGNDLQQGVASEQRGGFYSQYREKRDEKLRAEHSGKRAVKEAQFKVMKESLEQSKAKMTSKTASSITGKEDSPNHSQRPRRNSFPPVLPKKELPKPIGMRKASSSKTSTLPATRKSWSAGALPRTCGTATPKTPYGIVSTTSNTTNCWTPLSTPSPIQPSPKAEKFQQIKKKGTPQDVKPSLKVQEEKKQSVTKSTNKNVKPKNSSTTVDESSVLSAKPSFYNKVTKKSSVVPLESKPFLKKGTGLGPARGSPIAARPKVSSPDDSLKNSGSHIQPEENEPIDVTAEPTPKILEDDVVEPADNDANVEVPLDNDINHDNSKEGEQGRGESDNSFKNSVKLPVQEVQVVEEVIHVSSPAWVEVNHQEGSASCDIVPSLTMSPELASAVALSSPRVHHSLSQMLLADNNEPEIIEWGNAENPHALVYQKDAPKGFKRLLKFARKSKGEGNMTDWASPSVFSEGDDDTEESKAASKRSSDALIRKAALQAKGYEPPKSLISGSFDVGNSSKRSMDYRGMNETLPAQSSSATATILDRQREGQNSAPAISTKATRSFFSLSTFRNNKSSDAKLQ